MSGWAVLTASFSAALVITGAFFFSVGTIGLLRLPDFYCRTHAATKCDTLGAGSMLLGLAVYLGGQADTLKILAIVALVLISSPTTGHALARAAFHNGLEPWRLLRRQEGDPG